MRLHPSATALLTEEYDAIVIGGGIGGLVAATYLAKGGARVLLLEARDDVGGRAGALRFAGRYEAALLDHVLYALDPKVVADLELYLHGLSYVENDMGLVALRSGGQPIVLSGGVYRTRRLPELAAKADERGYRRFRHDILNLAQFMRLLWQGDFVIPEEDPALPLDDIGRRLAFPAREAERIDTVSRMSAAAYLDGFIEGDALKAALAFDVSLGGFAPHESGSALLLLWRAAQWSAGRPGAAVQPWGGVPALAGALKRAAENEGVEMRTHARVASILVEDGRVRGVALQDGEIHRARLVLSSLGSRETLDDLVPPSALPMDGRPSPSSRVVAAGKVLIALEGLPPVPGLPVGQLKSRIVIAGRPETADEVKAASLVGRLPGELVLEMTVPTATDPHLAPAGCHIVSLMAPLLPVAIDGGWANHRDTFGQRAIRCLESFAPGLTERMTGYAVVTPADVSERCGTAPGTSPFALRHLLSTFEERVRSPILGLYFCGSSAEPVTAISGRAGRVAARLALADLRRSREAHA